MRETKRRSWTKSLVWRAIGVVILGALAYIVTGDVTETTVITMAFHTIRTVLYYYHERAWIKIEWGMVENKSLKEKPPLID